MNVFKKAEFYGFKSFADKIEIDFSGGVTCIVGPNGCGKSNVSDAVRWVLGEQSPKSLRGSNMQDVIFKGTEKRSPLGYCEVSLHFDNTMQSNGSKLFPASDYSDVVISRKLFKSGESEYLINHQNVRLKDITNLLHDSGIDRDGLTIICQGQVSEIITSKPEVRRGIIEEAAGISRYKSTQAEARRKLLRTADDLARVMIVINEIERNLGPLLKQAQAAQEYVLLRDELKMREASAFVVMYDSAAEEKGKLRDEMQNIDDQIKEKQAAIAKINTDTQDVNAEIDKLDNEAEGLRDQVTNLSVGAEREQNNRRLELYEGINVLRQERAALRAKENTIKNLIESGEGYKYSVKKLLSSKNRNIVGVVAKELAVPTELETAIEVALGAAAQNVITEDEEGASRLIAYLRDQNAGRATFLPISAAKAKTLNNEERRLINRPYVVGVASDLVGYNTRIEPVVLSLLGRVVVVDCLDNAIELVRDMRYSAKIVTLDGEVIETRGSITGGSKNALNNNLWHTNQLAMVEQGLLKIEERLAILEGQLSEFEKSAVTGMAEGASKTLSAVKELLDAIAERKGILRASISGAEDTKLKLSEEIAGLTHTYYKTEAAEARIDQTIEQMQTRMEEEYGMNYSACFNYKNGAAPDNVIVMAPLEENLKVASQIKRKINAIGSINIDAIEQSGEAKERFDDYSTQVADLEKAKADLEKVINDLDSEMMTKFKDTFEAVNKNFGIVFKELFGGGKASLNLLPIDENGKIDYLTSGIDFVAEPPGKKLSNLALLSGGEKALTAIALLFAILKVKPMPFCVLDEIEAALDDANVGRFAGYLSKFAETTQFIVITHRKGTMELANNLYGVTMEEKGVSKIVSVKLESWAEENMVEVDLTTEKVER
ncbi:MAG: AAA family ATPase [Firmicutes bacterium]|nr:AAA family ATPase [Bacillota bacterium]